MEKNGLPYYANIFLFQDRHGMFRARVNKPCDRGSKLTAKHDTPMSLLAEVLQICTQDNTERKKDADTQ